jgi:predicted nucleic acid-binding protein
VTQPKRLVLDANILLRAVFGVRVRDLLDAFEQEVAFHAPDESFEDAQANIPLIAATRKIDPLEGFAVLEHLATFIKVMEYAAYGAHEVEARDRMARDLDDWPIAAAALTLNCPIWTEDHDFFGCGIATWTTANIPIYFRNSTSPAT